MLRLTILILVALLFATTCHAQLQVLAKEGNFVEKLLQKTRNVYRMRTSEGRVEITIKSPAPFTVSHRGVRIARSVRSFEKTFYFSPRKNIKEHFLKVLTSTGWKKFRIIIQDYIPEFKFRTYTPYPRRRRPRFRPMSSKVCMVDKGDIVEIKIVDNDGPPMIDRWILYFHPFFAGNEWERCRRTKDQIRITCYHTFTIPKLGQFRVK